MNDQETYVPDGDPCPKAAHYDQPTTLVHVPGTGYFSQCIVCIDDFFAWYGGPTQQRPATLEPPVVAPRSPRAPAQTAMELER